jgi:NAD(P)H-hydrate epimerase
MRVPLLIRSSLSLLQLATITRHSLIVPAFASSVAMSSAAGSGTSCSNPNNCLVKSNPKVSYINADTAKTIDELLMGKPGFTLDQLMELAGLSVATAAHMFFTEDLQKTHTHPSKKVLVVCGPGNNGGDGLVATRHLFQFGYTPTVLYPKSSSNFDHLVQECRHLDVKVLDSLSKEEAKSSSSSQEVDVESSVAALNDYDLIIDAIFGFSFHGSIRKPFDTVISAFARTSTPILSVDVPSGWNVDIGDDQNTGFNPAAVISLSFPKLCMAKYTGVHFLGGRLV